MNVFSVFTVKTQSLLDKGLKPQLPASANSPITPLASMDHDDHQVTLTVCPRLTALVSSLRS